MDIKTNRPDLNKEQKKAAFCTGNAVVSAGAGSGKTMVLANRFAWLLTEKGYEVDEILTLTFTKKAAAQMFGRIYSLVSEIAEKETGLKHERARRALGNFIHARIQTLDSYSASLVKQCAHRYGISPGFQIDEERCREITLEVSYPFLIAHRHHPAIERLYYGNRPDGIVGNILANVLFNYCHIDKPVNFTANIKTQFDIICVEWEKHREKLKTILNEIECHIFKNNELLPAIVPIMEKYKKDNIDIPDSSAIREYFDQLLNAPSETLIEEAESHPIQETFVLLLYFLASINNLSLREGKRSGNPVKENVKQIRELLDPVSSLIISCMQAALNLSVMPLLAELQSRYMYKKRAEGVLTFRDVANLSRTILIEQEDIRQSEKESFKAIMIDEFQDNNELQKDMLFLLAEKLDVINKGVPPAEDLCSGKLFFVGDEKQSIYLFRGADVSVFRRLKDELKTADLPLTINYRSAPQLIGAFNAIFGGGNCDPEGKAPLFVFPSVFAPSPDRLEKPVSQPLPLYEASYAPLKAENNYSGNLTLCILNKSADDTEDESGEKKACLSADENEARFAAEKIRQLLDEKTETGGQKYQGNDIAILLRARTSQYYFEKHLRLLDIPCNCEDINDLFYGGLVNDIMSVLRLAAHPLDSAAYAEMLRSPFAGLSLSGTALCLSFFCNEKEASEPFNDMPLAYLDEADREKYCCGQKIYTTICKRAESETISSLVSELWYKEGYRYETEWNPQTNIYRELFDYLFHLAAKADAGNKGLASFTDSMRSFRDSGSRLSDIDIPLERPSAVHLMTIHKSKGLEFPVVFLCGCGKKSQTDSCDDVYFSDEAGVVFSSPAPPACRPISGKRNNYFWQRANRETKRKRTAELRRLLYVGMTRAEKELYITGSLDIKNSGKTDNFPLLIKNYTEKKCADNENYINGDSILDNDTFFGLLLPSIVQHMPSDGFKASSSFFNLEEIPVYTEDYIKKYESKIIGFTNDQKGLNEFIEKAEACYKNTEVIKTPVLYDNHITPVSLRSIEEAALYGEETGSVRLPEDGLPYRGFFINGELSGEKSDDIFKKVDLILEKFSQTGGEYAEKFNSGGFGTIAHICVEAHLNRKDPVIPANLAGYLSPSEMETLLDAGMELANRFVHSPMGKIAESAVMRKSEFSFRSLIKNEEGNGIFINGTVDLIFEAQNSIHVVDFKTDNREIPAGHTAQIACYYRAASSIFALPAEKECRAWLYYLRTGHAVEMTERVSKYNLEEKVFGWPSKIE
ncbi:MAG: UvrD-helicase domain-containing protein [Treponema sp.]|jgi:ATP-dependent helicase/nuclease subunit A|nr:UvrD-helicase domain-containing protein [Treponema sp.]